MSGPPRAIISLVELIIYIALTPVVCFTAYKHGKRALLGHIFLLGFIGLRAAADGLSISFRNQPSGSNPTEAIVNSIGLSPLLIATLNFSTLGRYYASGQKYTKQRKVREILFEVLLHLIIITALALLVVGYTNASDTTTTQDDRNNGIKLAKAGAVLFLSSWLLIALWTLLGMHKTDTSAQISSSVNSSRELLVWIALSLPFTGIRVIYTTVYSFDRNPSLNPENASTVMYVFLVFLSQLFAAWIIVTGLLVTRNHREQMDHRTPETV